MIVCFAIGKSGEGAVMEVGMWDSLEEIEIWCECLAEDAKLTFIEKNTKMDDGSIKK